MSNSLFAAVLARLKLISGAKSDAALSRALSISPQTLSSWKGRGNIPYSVCIEFARQHGCSLDWLLLGTATQAPDQPADTAWEHEMLERLRSLSPGDRQATLSFIKEKQRIQQLEQQLSTLAGLLPAASHGAASAE